MHWLPVVTLLVVTPTQPPAKALVERIVDGIRDITGGGIGHNPFRFDGYMQIQILGRGSKPKGDVLLSIPGNPLIYRAYVSAILSPEPAGH